MKIMFYTESILCLSLIHNIYFIAIFCIICNLNWSIFTGIGHYEIIILWSNKMFDVQPKCYEGFFWEMDSYKCLLNTGVYWLQAIQFYFIPVRKIQNSVWCFFNIFLNLGEPFYSHHRMIGHRCDCIVTCSHRMDSLNVFWRKTILFCI